ncbi:protein-L-isoaspartate(D-aspartate) O-methyltransferase [Halobacteriovorax sp. GB3]|uniref:protein-L-isoaspartate(D-aspartate) O-methyltransferase n=1 Tax=Halobacteriovorax sp. GB3 TaxID=2719615 RepID=UPI00235FEE58|nr:protein-L-isoaspartate(D-aspartate) O-methyltransferase [Halobacteriovorax sp. GB3]MDD0851823.1 protein-L-isoaspartate(D-aspartate) O-methyltransferase [Halobacteriovorax sp. GB3]
MANSYKEERMNMVDRYIKAQGINNERVLEAMERIPRHEFIPKQYREYAYDNTPLPIGLGQTISQPYIVAYMTEALEIKESDRVLEIGTGSGYQAAILGVLAKEVYSVELLSDLAQRANDKLQSIGIRNISIRIGNGYNGWSEKAPFNKIIVTAAPKEIPIKLIEQLAKGGMMILPVGEIEQVLFLIIKNRDGTISKKELLPVRFVPMIEPLIQ